MNDIVTMWNKGHIPIYDAVYFPDGTLLNISIQYYPFPAIVHGKPFITNWQSIDSSTVTSIGETFRLDLFEFGTISLGEGAFGSEGFFAYFNRKNELQWVCYSERCNPFITAENKGEGHVIIESSADYRIMVDLLSPQNMYIL